MWAVANTGLMVPPFLSLAHSFLLNRPFYSRAKVQKNEKNYSAALPVGCQTDILKSFHQRSNNKKPYKYKWNKIDLHLDMALVATAATSSGTQNISDVWVSSNSFIIHEWWNLPETQKRIKEHHREFYLARGCIYLSFPKSHLWYILRKQLLL